MSYSIDKYLKFYLETSVSGRRLGVPHTAEGINLPAESRGQDWTADPSHWCGHLVLFIIGIVPGENGDEDAEENHEDAFHDRLYQQ